MDLKTRRLIFFAVLIVFVVVGGYLALRAQGLVLDWKQFRLVKTGGLFLKYQPGDAEIYLNGKTPQKTSSGIFTSGILVKDLTPGSYTIEVRKNGWTTWEKTLAVKSGFITSASQIRLWPKEIKPEKIEEDGVTNFHPTGKGFVFQNEKNLIFNGSALRGEAIFLSEPESRIMVTEENESLFLIDLDAPKTAINLNQLFNSLKQRQLGFPGEVPILDVLTHPFTPQKILILTRSALYALDFRKLALEQLFVSEDGQRIEDYAKSGSEVFVWDGKTLNTVNLLLKIKSTYPLEEKAGSKLIVGRGGTTLVLRKSGELYSYNRGAATSTPLAEGVTEAVLSPEEKRVAVLTSDGALTLLYLRDYQSDIEYKALTKNTLLPAQTENKIKNLTWFPKTNHLAALVGEKLWIAETDTRDNLNAANLLEGIDKFSVSGNELYFLKAGEFFKTSL